MKALRFFGSVCIIVSISFLFSCSDNSSSSGPQVQVDINHGILRVDDNGRYFVFKDGTPYIPVGLNHFLLYKQGAAIDSIVHKFSEHGINYLRLWVGLGADPETEVGKFDEKQMKGLDSVVYYCNKYGVYLNICFWNENCITEQKGSWGWNGSEQIYNKTNNSYGTTTNADDLRDTLHAPSWNAMKNRYAFFVERWKKEPVVIMWDLANDSKKSDAWKAGMYKYVKKTDGTGRIVTFQYNTGIDPKGEMDCGSVRVYDYNPKGNDPEEMMLSLAERIRQGLSHGNPVYCGEGRMNYKEGSEYALERGFLHFLWAPIAVGAAGNLHSWISPDVWPELTEKELDLIKCYSDFCKTIDWSGFNSRNADPEIVPEQTDIKAFACRSKNEAMIYLMNDDRDNVFKPVKTKLRITSQFEKGKYELTWIDIRTGKKTGSKKISHFPADVKTPDFKDGLFGHIRRTDIRQ